LCLLSRKWGMCTILKKCLCFAWEMLYCAGVFFQCLFNAQIVIYIILQLLLKLWWLFFINVFLDLGATIFISVSCQRYVFVCLLLHMKNIDCTNLLLHKRKIQGWTCIHDEWLFLCSSVLHSLCVVQCQKCVWDKETNVIKAQIVIIFCHQKLQCNVFFRQFCSLYFIFVSCSTWSAKSYCLFVSSRNTTYVMSQ